jgi:hypothetical protein
MKFKVHPETSMKFKVHPETSMKFKVHPETSMKFKVHPDLKALLPPQSEDERRRLTEKIAAEGCAPGAIVVASSIEDEDEYILIDGHNTVEVCEQLGIRYSKPRVITLKSLDEAREWIINNQLARRNLTDEQRAYFIGKKYLAAKQQHVGQTVGNCCPPGGRVSEEIAKQHGIAERTVRNNAQFAEAVDHIGATDPAAKEQILTGQSGETRAQIIARANGTPGDAYEGPILC